MGVIICVIEYLASLTVTDCWVCGKHGGKHHTGLTLGYGWGVLDIIQVFGTKTPYQTELCLPSLLLSALLLLNT